MNKKNLIIQTIKLSEYELILTPILENRKSFFAYFYGAYNKQNKSWCSDCNISGPLIEQQISKLENANNILFLKFPIENSTQWRDKKFIYRINYFKLSRIPTLMFYNKGNELDRLIEDELFDESNIAEFFKKSISLQIID